MYKTLQQMVQTCISAAHLIDIDDDELELIQSDHWKHSFSPQTICKLIALHDQATDAINDELVSLCGEVCNE